MPAGAAKGDVVASPPPGDDAIAAHLARAVVAAGVLSRGHGPAAGEVDLDFDGAVLLLEGLDRAALDAVANLDRHDRLGAEAGAAGKVIDGHPASANGKDLLLAAPLG